MFDFLRDAANIRRLAELGRTPMRFGDTSKQIRSVALLVVVPAELEPVEQHYNFSRNAQLEKELCGQAAQVMSGTVGSQEQGFELHIVAFATSSEFGSRYNS